MTTGNTIFIPLDQDESAKHFNIDTLLPQKIYKDLAGFVGKALDTANEVHRSAKPYDPDEHRSHHAILVAGSRGTGKSSVLVNLPAYLEKLDEKTFKNVHILKPVDPTLLEDHDSLFLNVIVAAVLSDLSLIEKQERYPEKYRELQQALYELGSALENSESFKTNKGIDKLRNFVGKTHVVQKVHLFFAAALKVLGKELLVITIDDVDTSLDQAFENLEVVRRYLTTPYVLPIISGDLNLYHDITCRDFHGRLLADSSYRRNAAWERADTLSREYLRKLLIFPRRLSMPEVSEYLADNRIELRENKEDGSSRWWSLACFHAWLTALHSGPVNGLENSRLVLPIPSVRALTHLIGRFASLTQHQGFVLQGTSALTETRKLDKPEHAARSWQMRGMDAIIESFQAAHNHASNQTKRDYSAAYLPFKSIEERPGPWLDSAMLVQATQLQQHWQSEPEGGACYLILEAMAHWSGNAQQSQTSVFKTPLFSPLSQQGPEFSNFTRNGDLLDWSKKLDPYMPEDWLERLPTNAILPYPVPEVGSKVALNWKFWSAREEKNEKKRSLLIALLHHRNFYDNAKRSGLICIGRIVELTITSFIREIQPSDIEELLLRPPYYSTGDIAPTKTQKDDAKDEGKDANSDKSQEDSGIAELLEHLGEEIKDLAIAINEWRQKNGNPRLSPWLVYNALNKTFNQAWLFNPRLPTTAPREADAVAWVARQAYYSLWAAFGSFEKGPLFGLPLTVATTNIGDGKSFENSDLFKLNIAPFWKRGDDSDPLKSFGRATRSITYLLGEFPLRKWVESMISPASSNASSATKDNTDDDARSKMALRQSLGLPFGTKFPQEQQLHRVFKNKTEDEVLNIYRLLSVGFPNSDTSSRLLEAIERFNWDTPTTSPQASSKTE